MRYTPANGRNVKVLDVDGLQMGTVAACDTAEGWIEMYVLRPNGKKVFSDRKKRELFTVRVHTDYDVVDRKSGRLLHRVRWSWSGPPRLLK